MKLFLFILLFCSSGYSQSQEKIPANIQQKINKAKDYYDISLFMESKKLLVELLHSEDGKNYEAEIRFHMGLASYYEGKYDSATNQWSQIIKKYPTSKRAKQLNRSNSRTFKEFSENQAIRDEDFEFSDDEKTGRLFWQPIPLNEKLFFGELQNGETAVRFYEELIKKYDDPSKKFNFLSYLFLINSGYNGSFYGYKNGDNESGKKNISDKDSEKKVIEILSQMENIVGDENDGNYSTLVQAYYLWAVKRSGSKILSGKVKVNKYSKPYFEKVIELTENNQNNIYRIFSQHWLEN